MTTYHPIQPQGAYNAKRPSLYRACVNADPAEYAAVEAKILKLYKEANE
jgi:hypothetical protein